MLAIGTTLSNSNTSTRQAKGFLSDKSIKFDGTDDQVVLSVALPSTFSVSFWFKQTDEVNGEYLFDSRNSGSDAWAAWTTGTSSHTISVWNGSTHTGGIQVPSGTWAHVVITVDGQYLNLYVNGEHDGAKAGYGAATTSDIKVGTRYTGGNAWQGSQDEWAIFSTALTARQVSDLYNNGQPNNLGSEANLAHWFRMGEGKLDGKSDGDENLLFDQGPNGGLGSELVTNGDLSTWTDTDTIATWNHKDSNNNSGGGVISQVGSGEGSGGTGLGSANFFTASATTMRLTSGVVSEAGKSYQLEIEVSRYVQGIIRVQGAVAQDFGASDIVNGKIVKLFTAASATYIRVQGSDACDFTIDNVSLKEVQNVGTINGPAIQADGGTELVVNGDFSNGTTSWENPSGGAMTSSVVSGKLRLTSSSAYKYVFQSFTTRVGGVYSFTVDATKGTSPNYDAYLGTGQNGATLFNSGSTGASDSQGDTRTITGTFTATSTTTFLNLRSRNEGSVTDAFTEFDNISVKEVTESVPKKVQNLPSAGSAKSLSFDGTDDLVDLGASSTFFSTNVNSISMWFKMPDTSGGAERIFVSNSDAGGSDLRVVVSTSGIISVDIWNGSSLVGTTGGSAIDDDIWHHLAYTTNASAQALYIDGVSVATTTHTRSSRAGSVSATIASHVTSNIYSDVDVDEVAIWDTVLDGDAVKALYNAGLPTPVTTKTGAYDIYRDNLKAYYKMGDASDPAADGTSSRVDSHLFDQTNPGLGAELSVADPYTSGRWGGLSTNIPTFVAGESVRFDRPATGGNTSGGYVYLNDDSSGFLTEDLVTTKVYKLTLLFETDDSNAYVRVTGGGGHHDSSAGSGVKTFYLFGFNTAGYMTFVGLDNGKFVKVSQLSVKPVNGNTGTITGATIQTEAPKAIMALPPVANTKSLNFDGTNDHLVTQVDANPVTNESVYYSWWGKSSDTGHNPVFSHGTTSTYSDKGAFHWNQHDNRPLLWMASSVYRYWVANTQCDDGAWHHYCVKIKYNAIEECELFIDTVKQAVSTGANSGSMNAYETGIQIGKAGDSYFNGSIDEFSIHEDLDEEAIRALFNRGRPIDISKSQGAYDVSDKALHWWRMGDATSPAADGTNDIIFQGFSEEGNELLTNGDFETGDLTGWTSSGSTVSVATNGAGSNALYISTSGASAFAQQNVSGIAGTIKVTFDLEVVSGGGTHVVMDGIQTTFASSGSYTMFHTSDGSTDVKFLRSGATEFYVDNVSVKQVRGQYTGPELTIANPYDSSKWSTYGNIISNPSTTSIRAARGASGGSNAAMQASLSGSGIAQANVTVGKTYKLSFDFETDETSGTIAYAQFYDGSSYVTIQTGSGSVEYYFTAANVGIALRSAELSPNQYVQFSNISLKEVGAVAVMTNMTTSDIQTDTPY